MKQSFSTQSPGQLQQPDLAKACKAAGDPLRMSILKLLGQGAFGVLELCRVFDIKQSSMSHHLKILAQAGLTSTQREGNSIFYRRPLIQGNEPFDVWLNTTFAAIDNSEDTAQDQIEAAVTEVLQERAQACAEFFARHAEDFKEQQDLIASHDQYGAALNELLNSVSGKQRAHRYALEIGPGEGAFIPALAAEFEHVTALDVSPDMLALTQQVVDQRSLVNVHCKLGDATVLHDQQGRYHFAVANMVLHHVPAPKTIFEQVAGLLADNGSSLITDLCPHEQTWARESCGDLWLGFDPADLTAWAREAGLTEGPSQFLGLRNGFQIQFRLFHKP